MSAAEPDARRRQQGVAERLGTGVICPTCGATLETYDEACSAPLDEACPGFLAIEGALA